MLLLDDGKSHDVFEVLEVAGAILRMRSPFLFEVGEEMQVRIERDGVISEATARVRAHIVDGAGKITELELAEDASW